MTGARDLMQFPNQQIDPQITQIHADELAPAPLEQGLGSQWTYGDVLGQGGSVFPI